MLNVDADGVRHRTPWPALIDAIAAELRADRTEAPERHVHPLPLPGGETGSLLLMPSWVVGELIVVKAVTYVPTNAGTEIPTISAAVLVFDGSTGHLVAALDGDELTVRRTAATSALAARYLARSDASRLLVVGTGQLAPNLALAHAQVRPIEAVTVWGRNPTRAATTASSLRRQGLAAEPTDELETAVAAADIVTCATGSTEALVLGRWLRPGTHLDLVGSFRPDMREADDDAITGATLFVDTVAGATLGGDLAQPMAAGLVTGADIAADLRALVAGDHPGRTGDDEITVFKSAGSALADLAAARLAGGGGGGGAEPAR
ncbi:MAG: ornithine cyclodeaminase family protein [Acidimicrobiales bacterium]